MEHAANPGRRPRANRRLWPRVSRRQHVATGRGDGRPDVDRRRGGLDIDRRWPDVDRWHRWQVDWRWRHFQRWPHVDWRPGQVDGWLDVDRRETLDGRQVVKWPGWRAHPRHADLESQNEADALVHVGVQAFKVLRRLLHARSRRVHRPRRSLSRRARRADLSLQAVQSCRELAQICRDAGKLTSSTLNLERLNFEAIATPFTAYCIV